MGESNTERSVPAVAIAICTYNRVASLPALVKALRAQQAEMPFDLLFVNNNSNDDTLAVLARLANEPGARLRFVTETAQGIVPARNRTIAECIDDYDYILVMDDDEVPRPGWIAAAVDALINEGAECVGGRVQVAFPEGKRPPWLGDELLGFLAQIDYGEKRFWIQDDKTPIWTANVGYRTALFRQGLRFDQRYNRQGKAVGGGEDVEIFRKLLVQKARIRYRPDMVVEHHVEAWRLRRAYFLNLHYTSGKKTGRWELPDYPNTLLGVPPFMLTQALHHLAKTLAMLLAGNRGTLRQAMNASHSLGMIAGLRQRRKAIRAQSP